jgi:hypothetical protein
MFLAYVQTEMYQKQMDKFHSTNRNVPEADPPRYSQLD